MDNQGLKVLHNIQSNQDSFKRPSIAQKDNTKPAALNKIDEIFTRLKAICVVGNSFKTDDEQRILKQEFMFAMSEEKVTNEMIDDAIDHFRALSRKSTVTTWFPTIAEFLAACLGSNNFLEKAEKAYHLFSTGKRCADNVSREMLIIHRFTLKNMKAVEGKKRFIELYIEFASKMTIKPLTTNLLTETVQLSPEQQKDRDRATESAKNEFFSKFNQFTEKNPNIPPEVAKKAIEKHHGIKQGSLKTYNQSKKEIEEIKQRQLDALSHRGSK